HCQRDPLHDRIVAQVGSERQARVPRGGLPIRQLRRARTSHPASITSEPRLATVQASRRTDRPCGRRGEGAHREENVLNHERLTIKAAEASQGALPEATRRGNPALEDVHLLAALLGQEETVVVPVLQKVGVNIARLREALEAVLERLPKQTGGATPAVSRELNQIFDGAERLARELEDEYTSTEHLLLGIAAQKGSTAGQLMQHQGATESSLRDAL